MVEIKIDMENREKLRRLHTATHILNYALREILGTHIWQNGSNLKSDIGSLDITHYENLTDNEISLAEKKVNQIIFANKKVYIEEIDRTEAEKKYGYILYQGGAIPMKKLRVVKIEENDIEACGGIHMLTTGGIGLFKIIDTQKIQDGVVRVRFAVNEYALDLISQKQKILRDVQEIFSVDESSVVRTSQKFFSEWKDRGKEIENLKQSLRKTYLKFIVESSIDFYDLNEDYDMVFLMDLFNEIIKVKKTFKLSAPKHVFMSNDFDFKVADFKKEINKVDYKIYIL